MLESNHERRMRFGGKSDALAVYDYDKNNRLLTTTETSGATVTTNTYYYDNNGNTLAKMTEVTAPSTGGQPSATLTETGSFAELYCYDLLNRMTYSNAEGVEATYKYRPDGLRFSKTVGSSETVHIWDGANIVGDAVNGAVTAAYVRGIGLIASKVSGVFTYYMHNAHGDVVHLVNNAGTVKRTYDYDAFGNEKSAAAFANVVTVTSGLPESAHPYANNYDNTWTYTHPGAGMLEITFSSDTITERNYDWIYIYDGSNAQVGARYSGNDLAGKTVTVFGDTVKIRLQTDGSITSYGFSLTSIVADLSVSVEKVTVTSGLPESAHPYANNYDHTWTYTHPGAGMLEITFSPDTITERNYDWIYLYDGNNAQVGARYSGNDLAGSTVTVPGDTVKIRLQTDVSITGYGFSLTSIAAIVITGNPVGGHDDDVNPFRFCGEYFDRETGTVYLRARYYNSRIGRFLTQDGWEFMNPNDPLSLNLYAYCANNPVRFSDPSGLTPVEIYAFINELIYAGEIKSYEYSWTAKGDQYTITINGYTLTYDGSGKNKHDMNIWVENGKQMAEDYDIAYFFRSSGWVQYFPGFEWDVDGSLNGQLYRVDTHLYFLSKSFSNDFAKEVMSLRSTDYWGGLTASDIAKESYAHAVMLVYTEPVKGIWGRASDWNESAKAIDIAPNDPRAWRFNAIWLLGKTVNPFANSNVFKNNNQKK